MTSPSMTSVAAPLTARRSAVIGPVVAAAADSAGQGRTPEGSLAARTSPGAAADLRLDQLQARWDALA